MGQQQLITYGFWFYEELRERVGVRPGKHHGDEGDREDSYITLDTPNYGPMEAKASGFRLELFRASPKCVACHRVGALWLLQTHRPSERPHLNLYHVGDEVKEWKNLSENGLVMMTKDHIIPKSRGGPTSLANLQTMCAICNGKKGNRLMDEGQWHSYQKKAKVQEAYERIAEMQCLSGMPHFK